VGTARRKLSGGFYAHGPISVAYLATEQPYDIPGVSGALRRARSVPAATYGAVQLRLHENEQHPETQCFIVRPGRRLGKRPFEELVNTIFPGCELDSSWVTDPRDPSLQVALLMELMELAFGKRR
jgi:hypothetical protein